MKTWIAKKLSLCKNSLKIRRTLMPREEPRPIIVTVKKMMRTPECAEVKGNNAKLSEGYKLETNNINTLIYNFQILKEKAKLNIHLKT
jgi:hypothetical protein